MLASALLAVAVIAASQAPTVQSVTGTVSRRSQGVVSVLTKKNVGKALVYGDSFNVAQGCKITVRTPTTTGPSATQIFNPSPSWQPLVTPLSVADQAAYTALQSVFDAAVIRRDGGITFPSVFPIPCSLVTIVAPSGPFKVTADDIVLYDRPDLDQRSLAQALLRARDVRRVTTVHFEAGSYHVDSPLMPHDEEAALLTDLQAADERHEANARHLARAGAFGQHRLYEFARYELNQLPRTMSERIKSRALQSFAPIRPAL